MNALSWGMTDSIIYVGGYISLPLFSLEYTSLARFDKSGTWSLSWNYILEQSTLISLGGNPFKINVI